MCFLNITAPQVFQLYYTFWVWFFASFAFARGRVRLIVCVRLAIRNVCVNSQVTKSLKGEERNKSKSDGCSPKQGEERETECRNLTAGNDN